MSKKGGRNRAARRLRLLRNCVIATVSGLLLERPAHGLTINLSYAPTVTALSYAASVESATSYAAQQIESLFNDNITININVVATSTNSFLGEAGITRASGFSYSSVRSDLISSATTPTDATAYASLPSSPDPTTGGNFVVATAEEKALGLIPANGSGSDGTFTFSDSTTFTFDPNNRAVPDEYDFIGVAEHEITHIMGRYAGLSASGYTPMDLFRYMAPGARSLAPSSSDSYFSIDGGVTDLMDYSSTNDIDDWASGTDDSFNSSSFPGVENDITPVDVAAMDVLGYHAVTTHILNYVSGGNWSSAGNWKPGNIPGAGDAAYLTFADGVGRTITYDYTGPAVTLFSLTLDLANATGTAATTLSMSANNLTVNGEEIVGHNGVGCFNQSGGTNTINGENGLFLGFNSGSTGTYSLSTTGSLTASNNEYVGYRGTGNFNQTGGTNTTSASLILGNTTNSTGNYTLSGTGSLAVNSVEEVGYSGAGNFNQGGGTNTTPIVDLGANAGSSGTYSLTGGVLNATYNNPAVNQSEIIGLVGTGQFTQSGGINNVYQLNVAYGVGSNGTYTLSNGTLADGASELVGYQGIGTLTQTGGTNTAAAINIGTVSGSSGSYALSGGSIMVTGIESVGYTGTGNFNQSAGTNTIGSGGALWIGANGGSTGSYVLSGTGMLNVPNYELVGNAGSGTFTQMGGTHQVGELDIGESSGSGTYSLSSGNLVISGNEYLGYVGTGSFTESGGTSTITQHNLFMGFQTGAAGSYSLSGTGSLSVAGAEEIGCSGTGIFTQMGGTNTIGTLDIGNSAGSTGTDMLSGGTTTVNGSAYVGGSASGAGGTGTLTISGSGQLTVAGTLTVYSTGRVNINGGTSAIGALSIATGGIVNVNGVLFIDYGRSSDPIASIAQWIKNGFYDMSGPQIISSYMGTDDALSGFGYGIGYADSADPGNPAGLPTDTIEIRYTLLGDANMDGTVNPEDFTSFSHNLGQSGMMWDDGDFNYDGTVNTEDFTAFSHNLNQSAVLAAQAGILGANGVNISSVPEPACAGMMVMAAVGILRRRRLSRSPDRK